MGEKSVATAVSEVALKDAAAVTKLESAVQELTKVVVASQPTSTSLDAAKSSILQEMNDAKLQSVKADAVANIQEDEKGVDVVVQAVAKDAAVDTSAVERLKAADVGVNKLIQSSEAVVTNK